MSDLKPVFIADSCIGGLSVVKSLWNSGSTSDVVFLADYAINPLGLKSDSAIADVVDRWLSLAEENSDTLVIACNTLSIRYQQLLPSKMPIPGLKRIVSMVDCFAEMVKIEAEHLVNRKVLIIGTEFTASQRLYPDILSAALPGVRIDTLAATNLEQKIARFQPWKSGGDGVFTSEFRQAIEGTDIAVLACTCFPIVRAELESLFPGVIFLDPGAYCSGLLKENAVTNDRKLSIEVTGNVVSEAQVTDFAKSYLDNGVNKCCI
jgi:glutamate racemase